MKSIKLDQTKLLGFRLTTKVDGGVVVASKVGGKIGTKPVGQTSTR